jgi:prevent-host-death family protein
MVMAVTVGIRELRGNLRAYLDRVRAGEEVVITERGRPVARLGPARSKLDQLIAEGRVQPARAPKRPIRVEDLAPPLRGDKTLSDYVIEGR